MSLSPYQVLAISAVLVGAVVAIWAALLRREFAETLGRFKVALRNYRKKRSNDLFAKIQCVFAKESGKEEGLDQISKHTSDWSYLTQAVGKLMEEEKRVHKWAKYVITIFALTFLMGIHASENPQEIFIGQYTRLDTLNGLFAIEILVSFYWLWMLYSFNRKIGTISVGEFEDVEEVIEEVIEKIKKEEKEAKESYW